MNLSYLPDIFALAVFIAAFRPLVRRVGAHVNLWFVGWSFIVLHYLARMFAGYDPRAASLVAACSLDVCALIFMNASANTPRRRMDAAFTLAVSLPTLVASVVASLPAQGRVLYAATSLLFLSPSLMLLTQAIQGRARRIDRSLFVVATAFAALGVGMVPVAARSPQSLAQGALSIAFLSAAYLYHTSAARYTRGVLAAVSGLAGWGLSISFALIYAYFRPGATIDRAMLEMPQYLVVAGIILTLLEGHVLRTERMAMHDALTDLPNRRLFEERLATTLAEARIARTTVACLVIDVDNFKTINDTLGHSAGDELLRALAVRLSWHMSPRDILARTGGDEFTALLAGVNDEHHLRFIASAMMSAASVPIAIDNQSVDVRISIGIALSPDHADDMEGLRRAADEAMYSAKRRGGSLLAFAGED